MNGIRRLRPNDIERVVELWYEASIVAHDFIPAGYWEKHKEAMATVYLPNSETYLSIEDEKITGFIAMAENFLAAIFVDNNIQGKGIGKKLLNYIKDQRTTIQLNVYKKNSNALAFYKSQGFEIISENKETESGEYEYLMEWEKTRRSK